VNVLNREVFDKQTTGIFPSWQGPFRPRNTRKTSVFDPDVAGRSASPLSFYRHGPAVLGNTQILVKGYCPEILRLYLLLRYLESASESCAESEGHPAWIGTTSIADDRGRLNCANLMSDIEQHSAPNRRAVIKATLLLLAYSFVVVAQQPSTPIVIEDSWSAPKMRSRLLERRS
jgi:hypothetical protein